MRNREIDDAAVQSDVRDFLPNFLPTHGSQQIMIFAPPKEEAEGAVSRIRASGYGAWEIGDIARRSGDGEQVVVEF